MAFYLPLPGEGHEAFTNGVGAGSQMFQNMLNKRQLQQQGQQYNQTMQQRQLEHQDTHAIQKQQQARLAELQPHIIEKYKQEAAKHPYIIDQYKRAAELAPLERQLKIAQINDAVSKKAQRDFDQKFVNQFLSGQMDNQEGAQEMFQGSSMQMPNQQLMEQSAQPNMAPPSIQQLQNGFGRQQMHPALAAKMKKLTGWDPNKETPSMQANREIYTGAAKERNKLNEKYRSENLASLEAAQDSLADVQQAESLLGEPGTPEYDYATSALGPLDSKTPAIREGTRKFRGEFNRLAGRMKANIARLEKGATSDKEREMFDKAEISESDTWTTAKGKLAAQNQYLQRLSKRKMKIEELMDVGYPRSKALEISMKEVPITNQINSTPKIKIRNKKTGEEREVTQDEYNALKGGG